MTFKVIHNFADAQDGFRVYKVGDNYPREGYDPTAERLEELKGVNNNIGRSLIKEIAEAKPKKASRKKK